MLWAGGLGCWKWSFLFIYNGEFYGELNDELNDRWLIFLINCKDHLMFSTCLDEMAQHGNRGNIVLRLQMSWILACWSYSHGSSLAPIWNRSRAVKKKSPLHELLLSRVAEIKSAFSAVGLFCSAWSAVKEGFPLLCHQPYFLWVPTESSDLLQVTVWPIAMVITSQKLWADKSVMGRIAFKIFPGIVPTSKTSSAAWALKCKKHAKRFSPSQTVSASHWN